MLVLANFTRHEAHPTMAVIFKGAHCPPEVILMGICCCVAWPLSTRHVEGLLKEPRVYVDHYTFNRDVGLPLISSRQSEMSHPNTHSN